MPEVPIIDLPETTHRALVERAGRNGRSTAAEIRDILQSALHATDRVKLGAVLAEIGRRAGLCDEDLDFRADKTPAEAVDFE